MKTFFPIFRAFKRENHSVSSFFGHLAQDIINPCEMQIFQLTLQRAATEKTSKGFLVLITLIEHNSVHSIHCK